MQIPSSTLLIARHRWNAPLIACLHRAGPLGPAELAAELGAARSAIARPLAALEHAAWIVRDPHGFALDREGRRYGEPCVALCERASVLAELAFRRWTLPVLHALHGWELRFNELRAVLPDITPRALTLTLKALIGAGLVKRSVVAGFPPVALYASSAAGRRLLEPLVRS